MSDSKIGTGNSEQAASTMPAADVKFLIACLQNTTGGSISIDKNRVAEIFGMKNPRSVANKLTTMKSKYNLPIGTGAMPAPPEKAPAGSLTPSNPTGPHESAVPKILSKQRVTKTRVTSIYKKKAAPNSKKARDEKGCDAGHENEDMSEDVVDPVAENKAAYENVIGKPGSDEDANANGDA